MGFFTLYILTSVFLTSWEKLNLLKLLSLTDESSLILTVRIVSGLTLNVGCQTHKIHCIRDFALMPFVRCLVGKEPKVCIALTRYNTNRSIKANSHVACRSPAMPCHKGFRMCAYHLIYTVRLCLIHTCHALTMPFFSRPQHSTAVERRPVGCLPVFDFFQLLHRVPLDCYQKHTNPPHNDSYLQL
jgi:hypothetical protein